MTFQVLWLQSGGCGGCTMSLLCAESPGLLSALQGAGVSFLWHPSLSEQSGADVQALLDSIVAGEITLDALCAEGALLRGPEGTGRIHILGGTGQPMLTWVPRMQSVSQ